MTDTHQGARGDARKRAQEAASASLSAEQPSEASPEVPPANGPSAANRVVARERLDPDAIAAIRERVEAATEGPWDFWHTDDGRMEVYVPNGTMSTETVTYFLDYDDCPDCGRLSPADATFIAHARTDVPLLLDALDEARAEVERLTAKLAQPCGSCHPCDHWAAETWREAGGKLPHKVEVDEAMERLRLVKEALLQGGQTAEIRWRDAVRLLDCDGWDFWESYETGGDIRAKAATARADALAAKVEQLVKQAQEWCRYADESPHLEVFGDAWMHTTILRGLAALADPAGDPS